MVIFHSYVGQKATLQLQAAKWKLWVMPLWPMSWPIPASCCQKIPITLGIHGKLLEKWRQFSWEIQQFLLIHGDWKTRHYFLALRKIFSLPILWYLQNIEMLADPRMLEPSLVSGNIYRNPQSCSWLKKHMLSGFDFPNKANPNNPLKSDDSWLKSYIFQCVP